jgi:hypothetical protein
MPLRPAAALLACAALAAGVAPARPAGLERPTIATTIESEWALETGSGRAQKLETWIQSQLDQGLPGGLRLTAIGRLHADAYERLAPGGPRQAELWTPTRRLELGDRVDLELRELYVEGRVGAAWLRIGKQQVVWGQADGLKVLDVVDPQDFREFVLDDFDDSRIPLWTANVELPAGPATLQLLWIPDPSVHDLPRRDALFAFRAPRLVGPRPPPGVAVKVRAPDRPDAFSGSDLGARLSGRLGDWDLTASYLWHTDDAPVLRRRLRAPGGVPTVDVALDYERAHVVGVTASNTFGELTVRLEAAYTHPRWLPSEDADDSDGAVRGDELGAVVGLDWYGFRDALLSLQLFPSLLPDDEPGLLRDRFDVNATLLARRSFRNERLVAEAIWMHNLNQGDGVVRPELRYELRDGLWVWAGLDWFYGTRDGLFGQYDARDRALLGFEWGLPTL